LLAANARRCRLAALFDHHRAEFSISDLAHVTDVAIATASRDVERLEAHGIVRSRNVGRSRFVSANWELLWADALVTILAHTAGLPVRVGSGLRHVPGVESAYLYGSWAARNSGEIGPPPHDIDVLVIGTPSRDLLRKALRPLESATGLEINPVVVSEVEWSTSDSASSDPTLSVSACHDAARQGGGRAYSPGCGRG
jgi:DNA-binding transcriptional ArsR family regulator